jgi:hypothetical protein
MSATMPDVRALTEPELSGYDHVPGSDALRARIGIVPFLAPRADGMTLGRFVLLRRGHADDDELLAHELVHVRQWREHGVAGFLARYLAAYVRGLVRLRSHRRAYLAIPLEAEARREAAAWAARAHQ